MADFSAHELVTRDDYPDCVVPLDRVVARGEFTRGLANCGSVLGTCVAASKVAGVGAALITDSFCAHHGVERMRPGVAPESRPRAGQGGPTDDGTVQ